MNSHPKDGSLLFAAFGVGEAFLEAKEIICRYLEESAKCNQIIHAGFIFT